MRFIFLNCISISTENEFTVANLIWVVVESTLTKEEMENISKLNFEKEVDVKLVKLWNLCTTFIFLNCISIFTEDEFTVANLIRVVVESTLTQEEMENISKFNFEKEVDSSDDWIDPYDYVWLKLGTVFVYIIEGRHPLIEI